MSKHSKTDLVPVMTLMLCHVRGAIKMKTLPDLKFVQSPFMIIKFCTSGQLPLFLCLDCSAAAIHLCRHCSDGSKVLTKVSKRWPNLAVIDLFHWYWLSSTQLGFCCFPLKLSTTKLCRVVIAMRSKVLWCLWGHECHN